MAVAVPPTAGAESEIVVADDCESALRLDWTTTQVMYTEPICRLPVYVVLFDDVRGVSLYLRLSLNSPLELTIPTSWLLNLFADAPGLLSVKTTISPAVPWIVSSWALFAVPPAKGTEPLVIRYGSDWVPVPPVKAGDDVTYGTMKTMNDSLKEYSFLNNYFIYKKY